MWRRRIKLKWFLLFLAGTFLFGICSRGIGRIKARSHIAAVFTDALKQPLPGGFASINADRFYSYGIYSGNYSIERLDGDVKASESLLAALSHNKTTVIEDHLRYDSGIARRADWWRPEQYGKGKFFVLEGNCEGRHSALWGYLFSESNGCALFLKLREP